MNVLLKKWIAPSENNKNKYYVLPYYDKEEKQNFIERQVKDIFKTVDVEYRFASNDKYSIIEVNTVLVHDSKLDYITISLEELIKFIDV
jgi:hypothetical protein